MYYLCKNGVGGHGTFWIGEDLAEGKRQADLAANSDEDSYHAWDLYEYAAPDETTNYRKDSGHEIVYTAHKQEE